MTKKKSKPKGLMMTARVVESRKYDDGMWLALNDGDRKQSFIVYFQAVDEELDVGDLVTVTIVKSEA